MRLIAAAIGLTLLAAVAMAQSPGDWDDPLDPYLLQAFSASSHLHRNTIFHIGVQGHIQSNGYRLSAVLEGYPAHQAGLQRGDLITGADGSGFHPVRSFNSGNPVLLSVDRNGDALELSLSPIRENLFDSYRNALLNSVQQFSVGNKVVGYIRLWGLSRSTADIISLQREIEKLALTDGLILDLRDGYGFTGPEHQALFRGSPRDEFYRKPIALLINERSRGNLPLLASELAELERVIIIGSPAANGALEPEVEVAHPLTESSRSDPVYQAAVDVLLGII